MPELDLPQIAESQALAYITSNDADALLEKALCAEISGHEVGSGDFTLTEADFRQAWHHVIAGTPAAAFTITLPGIKRPFMMTNSSGQTATVQTGSGNAGQLLDTETRLFYCDGNNVLALSDNAVSGGSAATRTGALLSKSLDQAIAASLSETLNWDTSAYDTDAFHDPLNNNSRLTIPVGIETVQLTAQIRWDSNSVNNREVQFYKNGSNAYTGRAYSRIEALSSVSMQSIISPVLAVTAGDYFEVSVWQNSGASRTVLSHDSCWFSLHAFT